MVCARLVEDSVAAGGFLADLGNVHVVQAVVFDGSVVEPGAVARLPLGAADHAEFGGAPAGHVVAALFQLDRCGAVVAALPAFCFCHFREPYGFFILWAFFGGMPFTIASSTNLGPTARTLAVFARTMCATRCGGFNVTRLYPSAATFCWTVKAILCRIFLILSVPFDLKFGIKYFLDMLERYAIRSTALWWHVGRIGDGHGEDSFEARMTHAVATCQLRSTGDGNVIGQASEALDP